MARVAILLFFLWGAAAWPQEPFDLIVAGGYGSRPVLEVVLGSEVDQLLRESQRPILICR